MNNIALTDNSKNDNLLVSETLENDSSKFNPSSDTIAIVSLVFSAMLAIIALWFAYRQWRDPEKNLRKEKAKKRNNVIMDRMNEEYELDSINPII